MATREQLASAPRKGSRSRNTPRQLDGLEGSKINTPQENSPPKDHDRFADGYDCLVVNSPMEPQLFYDVIREITKGKKKNKLLMFLVSLGGLADPAYKTGRYLQSTYDEITACIPSYCKSAGTLLAVAANSIIMSPFGELGPLDVQLRKRDEIFGRRSGLITRAAISDLQSHTFEMFEHFMLAITSHSYGSVSFKTAADISAKMSAEIMSKIYEQINPDSLGQDFRDLSVATKYCERLAKRSKNITEEGIRRLVHDYPSHNFVIDSEEAKEIFSRVDLPTVTISNFLRENYDCLIEPRDSENVVVRLIAEDENDDQSKRAQGEPGAGAEQAPANGRDADAEAPA